MKLRSLLRLLRIPNVFTAFADAAAGVCLARGGSFERRDLALLGASGALYLAGMVWNDVFDRRVDARERPDRPIPAGEVTLTAAIAIGIGLFVLGLGLAHWHGARPRSAAMALTACILLYDAGLKNTALGPWAMGACRALNVGLGLSVTTGPLPKSVWFLPFILGLFTLLITRLSRFEVAGTEPKRLHSTLWGFAVLAAPLGPTLCWVIWTHEGGSLEALLTILTFGYFAARSVSLLAPLAHDVRPSTLGQAIGGCILLMPALDAAFLAASGYPIPTAAVFALAGPTWLLRRWFYMT